MNLHTAFLVLPLLFGLQTSAFAASPESVPESVPLYRVTVVQNSAKAINYRYLKGSTKIDFKGTVLLAQASGVATVKSKAGATEIDASFEGISAASQFGGEYLTYVLWGISPEGRASNLGELILKNGKARLQVTEQLQTFGMIVTAEPYFAVSQPSNVVVMENAVREDTKGKIELIDAKYDLLQRGQYTTNIVPADLAPMTMDKKTPFAVYQARNALRISRAAGAEVYATDAYNKAKQLLKQAEVDKGGAKARASLARESVQRSEDARLISVKRHEEQRLAAERQQSLEQVSKAKSETASAVRNMEDAEAAQGAAERAVVRAEAGRVSAEQGRGQAETERNAAVTQAGKAESEKAALRGQLFNQLNSVLQTRDTARGLIVNMSDVLFQSGKSELRPQVREKLAKIAGIVIAHPGLKLEVEGHTDSVGDDAYNQNLSEQRASATRDYLVSQGVSRDAIVSRGFGETSPVSSNATKEGQGENRRVELVVSGALISSK